MECIQVLGLVELGGALNVDAREAASLVIWAEIKLGPRREIRVKNNVVLLIHFGILSARLCDELLLGYFLTGNTFFRFDPD